MPDWTYVQSGVFVVLRCRSPPFQSEFEQFQKFQIGGKKNGIQQRTGEQEMAYLERSRGKNIAGAWS